MKHIRIYIFIVAGILTLLILLGVGLSVDSQRLQIIRVTQLFAFTAVLFLYATLLISPLTTVFPHFPFHIAYAKARKALGLSAFFFACVHAGFAFFGQLGGFAGLTFLSDTYLVAILLSTGALGILTMMAITSSDKIIARMTFPKWKQLHRMVYLAGVLIVIHGLMLGTHFQDISELIPQISTILLAILLILEAIRFDRYLKKKIPTILLPGISLTFVLVSLFFYLLSTFHSNSPLSLGIHSQHIQLAQQAQKKIPGQSGDPTRRFTVSFSSAEQPVANQPVTLHFKIYNASTGDEVKLFSTLYEKTMHLIIVNNGLTYFEHLHPIQDENDFTISTIFPKDDNYRLYLNFQPLGGIEQQDAFTLSVGSPHVTPGAQPSDLGQTKIVSDYEITLNYPKPLIATNLSLGQQLLSFTIKDAKTKKPITTLSPYLGSFGHLVLINTATYDYLHVHPTNLIPVTPTATGGPTVDFQPIGIYGPFKVGIYKAFAQFNTPTGLITADFYIKIQ